MCKRLTQIFLTFFQDAGQVNPGTSFYKQFEWKRNCESELDKFFSYQTSDITCADLMLMREIYCSRSFGLAQHIETEKSFRQICVVSSEVSFSATTGNRTILTLYW